MDSNNTFTCRSCKEVKPLSEFPLSARAKSGHIAICKACHGARISAGRVANNLVPPQDFSAANPKFAGQTPRQLIAALKELITELKFRGYSYKGELTYLQKIKL